MDKRAARRRFFAEWLLEFSVLLAVFPGLDQALRGQFDARILVGASVLAVLSFGLGFLLTRDGD